MAKLYLTIKEAAKELGMTTQGVRHYEAKGVLIRRRNGSDQRYYKAKEIAKLKKILQLKGYITVKGIRALMNGSAKVYKVVAELKAGNG